MNKSYSAFIDNNHVSKHFEPGVLSAKKLRIVLSSVSSDSHTWNLVFIQLMLEELGHEVLNLGACTPDELIIENCRANNPDMLVISSVNGHGHIDGERLIRKLRASGEMQELPAVIGGKLGILGAANVSFTDSLIDAGFNAVFEASTGTASFENYVHQLSLATSIDDTSTVSENEIR